MPTDKPVTAKQLKKIAAAQRNDLHKLAALIQKQFHHLNRRLDRLTAEEKRKYSVIELAGKRYRFLK